MKSLHYFFFLVALAQNLPSFAQLGVGVGRRPSQTTETPAISYAQPKEYTIAGLNVSGTKFLDNNSLLNITGLREGDRIKVPGIATTDAIKKLMDQGILEDVQISATKIEGDKIWLDIFLKERPRLSKLLYVGIKKGEQESLNEKLKASKGKIITSTLIKNTELTIRKFYLEKGFLNAKIKILQISDTIRANQATLKIDIAKQEKVKISHITFDGNKEIPISLLKRKLKGTKEKRFGRIFTPSKFIPKKFEEDKEKLVEFLNKKGYRDARFITDSVIADGKDVKIAFKIEEGPKYYYRNITWEGNYIYPDSVLSAILAIKKGDVYSPEALDKKMNGNPGNDVSSVYMDDGYLFYRAEPEEAAVVDDSIDVVIRVSEGKQATINKIILNGNTKTSDHVVLREIRTLPGQKFNKSLLVRTNRELATLGYFDPEKIGINPVPHGDGTVDIEYTVEEKASDQIELSGGWGGYIGFVGTLGVVFNNFSARNIPQLKNWRPLPSGDGQKLSIRFQASGKQYQNYSLSFTEPWLGGKKPQSLSVSINRSILNIYNTSYGYSNPYGGVGTAPILGERLGYFNTTSMSVSLGKRLRFPDDWFTLSTALSVQLYDFDGGTSGQSYLRIPGISTGKATNISLIATLARNSIDNPTFPRRGSSFTLTGTFTPPYSLFRGKDWKPTTPEERYSLMEFHKWMFDGSWYTPLAGKFVLSARAHMGFIGKYNSNMDFIPIERFVMGGAGMAFQGNFAIAQELVGLRGYKDRILFPQTILPATNGLENVPIANRSVAGGIVYNKFVMEMRYPVSLNPSATIFLLGFLEGGNTWSSYQEFKPFNLYRSAGIGARIFMPAFGMIGIDFGKAFDAVPGNADKGQQTFTFTIGSQIR